MAQEQLELNFTDIQALHDLLANTNKTLYDNAVFNYGQGCQSDCVGKLYVLEHEGLPQDEVETLLQNLSMQRMELLQSVANIGLIIKYVEKYLEGLE